MNRLSLVSVSTQLKWVPRNVLGSNDDRLDIDRIINTYQDVEMTTLFAVYFKNIFTIVRENYFNTF